MGDIEMWELIEPVRSTSARRSSRTPAAPAATAAARASSRCCMIWNTPSGRVQNIGDEQDVHLAVGPLRRLPRRGRATVHNIRGTDLLERAAAGEAYPVADGPFDDPELLAIDGEREYKQRQLHDAEQPIDDGDLYLLGDAAAAPGSATRSSARPSAVAARRRRGPPAAAVRRVASTASATATARRRETRRRRARAARAAPSGVARRARAGAGAAS